MIKTIVTQSTFRTSSRAFRGRRASDCHIVLPEYILDVSRQLSRRGEEILPVCAENSRKKLLVFFQVSANLSRRLIFPESFRFFLENLKQNKLLSLLSDVGIFCRRARFIVIAPTLSKRRTRGREMRILAACFKSSATVQRARLRPPQRNYST